MPFLIFNFTINDSLVCADGYSYLLGNFMIQYVIRYDKQMIKKRGEHPSRMSDSSYVYLDQSLCDGFNHLNVN